MILDCMIVEGNPADTTLAIPMLKRQKQIYGRYPLKACFDGGFASKSNLKQAKELKKGSAGITFYTNLEVVRPKVAENGYA